jgi:hypothetical protein
MKLGPQLLLLLNKTYEPSALVETAFQRYDLAFKTNEHGKPILLFIGKKDEQGKIKANGLPSGWLPTIRVRLSKIIGIIKERQNS